MKFGELRAVCNAAIWCLEVYNAEGIRREVTVNLFATPSGREKMTRYDGAEVVRVNPIQTVWDGEQLGAMEVEINA